MSYPLIATFIFSLGCTCGGGREPVPTPYSSEVYQQLCEGFTYRDCYVLYEEACAGVTWAECVNLPVFQLGQAAAYNMKKSKDFRFWEDACKREESAVACFNVGEAYLLGEGVPQNRGLGGRYMDMACKMGSAAGCKWK